MLIYYDCDVFRCMRSRWSWWW